MIKAIFSILYFLFLILIWVTVLPNNAIAEKLLVRDGKSYICAAVKQGYCTTCSGKKIPIEGGSITATNKTCIPSIKPPVRTDTSTDKKKDLKK
jgi:hypothetical protein